jgi:tetratricopeptide (TPR) repeat protein
MCRNMMRYNKLIYQVFSLFTGIALVAPLLQAKAADGQSEPPAVAEMQMSALADRFTVEYAQDMFDRFYEAAQYDEATDAGKLVIGLLVEQEDYDKLRWSEALTQLASAQQQEGQFDVAIQNYSAAIDIIETDTNRLSEKLVDPLWKLSQTYADAGELDTALMTYKKTLHVYQVNSGLYNLEQMKMLAEMSEVWFRLGDYARADELQRFCVNLANHEYPGDNLLKLPAMYGRANMLSRAGNNVKSQKVYRQIVAMIENVEGTGSITLLPVLYELADLFLYNEINDNYYGPDQARRYLRRAVKITAEHEQATALQKADALLAMGDFLALKTADRASTLHHYRQAWDWLSADSELRAARDQRFTDPLALNDVPSNSNPAFLDLIANSASNDTSGIVVVSYTVSSKGEVKDMRVTESRPDGYKDYIVKTHLRNIAFRPRFVDREPTAALDRRYEVRYSYADEELSEKHRDSSVAAPPEL